MFHLVLLSVIFLVITIILLLVWAHLILNSSCDEEQEFANHIRNLKDLKRCFASSACCEDDCPTYNKVEGATERVVMKHCVIDPCSSRDDRESDSCYDDCSVMSKKWRLRRKSCEKRKKCPSVCDKKRKKSSKCMKTKDNVCPGLAVKAKCSLEYMFSRKSKCRSQDEETTCEVQLDSPPACPTASPASCPSVIPPPCPALVPEPCPPIHCSVPPQLACPVKAPKCVTPTLPCATESSTTICSSQLQIGYPEVSYTSLTSRRSESGMSVPGCIEPPVDPCEPKYVSKWRYRHSTYPKSVICTVCKGTYPAYARKGDVMCCCHMPQPNCPPKPACQQKGSRCSFNRSSRCSSSRKRSYKQICEQGQHPIVCTNDSFNTPNCDYPPPPSCHPSRNLDVPSFDQTMRSLEIQIKRKHPVQKCKYGRPVTAGHPSNIEFQRTAPSYSSGRYKRIPYDINQELYEAKDPAVYDNADVCSTASVESVVDLYDNPHGEKQSKKKKSKTSKKSLSLKSSMSSYYKRNHKYEKRPRNKSRNARTPRLRSLLTRKPIPDFDDSNSYPAEYGIPNIPNKKSQTTTNKEKTENVKVDNTLQLFNVELSCRSPIPKSPTRLRVSDIDFLKNLAQLSKQRSPDRNQENPVTTEESARKELKNIFGECSRKIEEEAKDAARNKREKSVGKLSSRTSCSSVNHERARSGCSVVDNKIKRKNPSSCSTGKKKKRNIFSINSQENKYSTEKSLKNRGAVTDKNFSEVKSSIEKSKELLKELYEDSKRMCMSKENIDTIKRDVDLLVQQNQKEDSDVQDISITTPLPLSDFQNSSIIKEEQRNPFVVSLSEALEQRRCILMKELKKEIKNFEETSWLRKDNHVPEEEEEQLSRNRSPTVKAPRKSPEPSKSVRGKSKSSSRRQSSSKSPTGKKHRRKSIDFKKVNQKVPSPYRSTISSNKECSTPQPYKEFIEIAQIPKDRSLSPKYRVPQESSYCEEGSILGSMKHRSRRNVLERNSQESEMYHRPVPKEPKTNSTERDSLSSWRFSSKDRRMSPDSLEPYSYRERSTSPVLYQNPAFQEGRNCSSTEENFRNRKTDSRGLSKDRFSSLVEWPQERPRERSHERPNERLQERSQERPQERLQERSPDRFYERLSNRPPEYSPDQAGATRAEKIFYYKEQSTSPESFLCQKPVERERTSSNDYAQAFKEIRTFPTDVGETELYSRGCKLSSSKESRDIHTSASRGRSSPPREYISSSRERTNSPKECSAPPRDVIALPREGIALPREGIVLPREGIVLPREGITLPREGVQRSFSPRESPFSASRENRTNCAEQRSSFCKDYRPSSSKELSVDSATNRPSTIGSNRTWKEPKISPDLTSKPSKSFLESFKPSVPDASRKTLAEIYGQGRCTVDNPKHSFDTGEGYLKVDTEAANPRLSSVQERRGSETSKHIEEVYNKYKNSVEAKYCSVFSTQGKKPAESDQKNEGEVNSSSSKQCRKVLDDILSQRPKKSSEIVEKPSNPFQFINPRKDSKSTQDCIKTTKITNSLSVVPSEPPKRSEAPENRENKQGKFTSQNFQSSRPEATIHEIAKRGSSPLKYAAHILIRDPLQDRSKISVFNRKDLSTSTAYITSFKQTDSEGLAKTFCSVDKAQNLQFSSILEESTSETPNPNEK